MIWSAVACARERLEDMKTRPVLVVVPPPPPGESTTVSTAGILLRDRGQLWIFCCIAWNEMSWSAMMLPFKRPVSCCGKKPFGTMIVQIDVESEGRDRDQQHDQRMIENPAQAALVAAQDPLNARSLAR
jgi:hypothetical protein